MLSAKITKVLNQQIKLEISSSYSYLAMAGYFDNEDLYGFAHFFRLQAKEELEHAMKIYDYMTKRAALPTLEPIDAPKGKFANPAEAFELGLTHERKVTVEINKVMDLAMAESDHATRVLLNWFVTEQLEEESLFESSLRRVKMVLDDPRGLLQLDREFAGRNGVEAPSNEGT